MAGQDGAVFVEIWGKRGAEKQKSKIPNKGNWKVREFHASFQVGRRQDCGKAQNCRVGVARNCGKLRQVAASCGKLRQIAANCGIRPLAHNAANRPTGQIIGGQVNKLLGGRLRVGMKPQKMVKWAC